MRNCFLGCFFLSFLAMPMIVLATAPTSELEFYVDCIFGPGLNLMLLIFGFVPIVLVEAIIIKKVIKIQKDSSAIVASLLSNAASTAISFILFVLMIFFPIWINNQISHNLGKFDCRGKSFILFLIATAVSFLLSVAIENLIFKRFFKTTNAKIILKAVWWANIVSYLLLLFFVFVCAGYPDNYFSDMIWK
jgi:predicted membrane protein